MIDPGRRWLVVVAHPDDEVVGCGALLSRLHDVEVVHVTDGAPRDGDDARRHGFDTPDDYAAARWREARTALDLARIPAERHHGFGVADQGATFAMAEIARRLLPMVARADAVLTHAYEGGHPDHDAVAFAAHAAGRRAGRPVFEMPFYHAGPDGWVRQRFLPFQDRLPSPLAEGASAEAGWVRGNGAALDDGRIGMEGAGSALSSYPTSSGHLSPDPGSPGWMPVLPRGEKGVASREQTLDLTAAEIALKRRIAACHATQGDTLASFDLAREVFRAAPPHDFTCLPHGGDLLYERHRWGLDRAGWHDAVRAATAELAGAGWP